jgi:hypothetical protein
MDQLCYIALTFTGFGWHDLMDLTDRDRLALLKRASEHNDRQQSEVDAMKSGMGKAR